MLTCKENRFIVVLQLCITVKGIQCQKILFFVHDETKVPDDHL